MSLVLFPLSDIEPLLGARPRVKAQSIYCSIGKTTFVRSLITRTDQGSISLLRIVHHSACVDLTWSLVIYALPYTSYVTYACEPVALRWDDTWLANFFIILPVALPELTHLVFLSENLRAAPLLLPVLHLSVITFLEVSEAVVTLVLRLVIFKRLQLYPHSIAFPHV